MADPIQRDILFLAMTRPTMRWGVPLEGLVINGVIQCYSFIWIGHGDVFWMFGSLLQFPLVHFAMRLLTSLDHNIFHELKLWAEVRGVRLKTKMWGGPILFAISNGAPSKAREMAGSV